MEIEALSAFKGDAFRQLLFGYRAENLVAIRFLDAYGQMPLKNPLFGSMGVDPNDYRLMTFGGCNRFLCVI